MATSSSKSDYYFVSETDNTKSCCSKICWLLAQLYHYTIGSCCYTPLRWLCMTLFYNCCTSCKKEETSQYERLSKIHLSENTHDKKWKRVSKVDEADRKMKQRVHHQFQDHIQKWKNTNHQRFPWKLILHLLLVVSVTVQVRVGSYAMAKINYL